MIPIFCYRCSHVATKVRTICSIRSSPTCRHRRHSPASTSVKLRVDRRRPRGQRPPSTGPVKAWTSAGRRPSGRGRSERVSQVSQSIDTSVAATGVRQAVPHRAGTVYQTPSQTHIQGNHDVMAAKKRFKLSHRCCLYSFSR